MNKLIRLDPFAELDALQRHFFGDDFFTNSRGVNLPTTDVYTNDGKELIVEAHLPHYGQDDVDIYIDNGSLVIQAERHEKEEDKNKKYVVRESASSFYRRIRLPERADAGKIEAHMENGLLKISVPFKELPEPKKIAIKTKNK